MEISVENIKETSGTQKHQAGQFKHGPVTPSGHLPQGIHKLIISTRKDAQLPSALIREMKTHSRVASHFSPRMVIIPHVKNKPEIASVHEEMKKPEARTLLWEQEMIQLS